MKDMTNSDIGHYVNLPVVRDELTAEVGAGETLDRVFLVGKRSSGADAAVDGEAWPESISIVPSLPFNHIIVGEGAKVNAVFLILPGNNVELPVTVNIIGEGADVCLSGLYLCGGEERVNIRTEIRHRVPSCTSNQLFNGIAAGRSKVTFFGKITVAPDAQKTEAYQVNHNIVLTGTAHAETMPQLEIYADDVKCSHGATVGQLNVEEQFYMRSRGIPEAEARVLQMISFIAPILEKVTDSHARDILSRYAESSIRRI